MVLRAYWNLARTGPARSRSTLLAGHTTSPKERLCEVGSKPLSALDRGRSCWSVSIGVARRNLEFPFSFLFSLVRDASLPCSRTVAAWNSVTRNSRPISALEFLLLTSSESSHPARFVLECFAPPPPPKAAIHGPSLGLQSGLLSVTFPIFPRGPSRASGSAVSFVSRAWPPKPLVPLRFRYFLGPCAQLWSYAETSLPVPNLRSRSFRYVSFISSGPLRSFGPMLKLRFPCLAQTDRVFF